MADYDIPDDCHYTKEDEWVRPDGDRLVVGITDYAQQQLGDVVFVELPAVGAEITAGKTFGVIESVKAVSDLYAPVTGRVAAINEALAETPENVNEACYGDGWMIAIEGVADGALDELMDAAAYAAYVKGREE
ncbi:MAG: glycine cleavage system protein GcvH [Myxococcota bacterium]